MQNYLFPDLIRGEMEDGLYQKDDFGLYSGWVVKINNRLGVRVPRSILLQLASSFIQTLSDTQFQGRVRLWKSGIFWCNSNQVEILVEIIHDLEIVMLCRGRDSVSFAKNRAAIVKKIRSIMNKLFPSANQIEEFAEYCLYPPPQCYMSLENSKRVSLSDIYMSLNKAPDRRACKVKDSLTAVPLLNILGFDSYSLMQTCQLKILDSEEQLLHTSLHKKLLELPELQAKFKPGSFISYSELCSILDKYSIFDYGELTESMKRQS